MTITQKVQVFFKEVYIELRKTNWLKSSDIIRYTVIVLLVTAVVAAFLGSLDYLFSTLVQNFVIN